MTATIDEAPRPRAERSQEGENANEASRLGMQLGEQCWLLDLADVSEVVPVPRLTPVPFTRPWFAGVAGVRGAAVAVVDLNAFFGGAPVDRGDDARLVVVAASHRINSGLLFSRVLGLQPFERFSREPDREPRAAWIEGVYRAPDERSWIALGMRALLTHPGFLRIELPARES